MEEMKIEEDKPTSRLEVLEVMAYPLFIGLVFGLVMLFLLGKGAKCETMAAATVATCMFGALFLFIPALTLVPMVVLKVMDRLDGFCFAAVLLYYAILLPPLVFVPPWQKVVPNVQNAYAEYKAKYPGNGHRIVFVEAEWWGNLTKPVFDWLAK